MKKNFKAILHCQQFAPGQIDRKKNKQTRISALSTNPPGFPIITPVLPTRCPCLGPLGHIFQ